VVADLRDSKPLVRLRVPFTLSRAEIDDVERGSQDADWDPVKAAAKKLAFAEDRIIFDGYPAASVEGIRSASSNSELTLPDDPRDIPDVVSQALSALRLAGVDGPYSVLLSADAYTKVAETSDHGYPILEHLRRLVTGDIIWAPASPARTTSRTRGLPTSPSRCCATCSSATRRATPTASWTSPPRSPAGCSSPPPPISSTIRRRSRAWRSPPSLSPSSPPLMAH
jgi:hypothetical protein